MKRAPIVLAGTTVGLIGVISYPTGSRSSAVQLSNPARATASQPTSTTSAGTASPNTTQSANLTQSRTKPQSAVRARTAAGSDVSFQYGDLQVKVTMKGKRVSTISVLQLNASDPHSQGIDQTAIPQLQQQALSAQNAQIDGVSGASFTSAAYKQSLQSALDKLRA
jgi:uncharacterized protein with FMN-binding domain